MQKSVLNLFFRMLLIVSFSFVLVACGGGEESESESVTQTQSVVEESTDMDNGDATVPSDQTRPSRASVSLSWGIPLKREDGSDLELYEIDGYVVAYGTDANNLDNTIDITGAGETQVVITDLPVDTYYFAIATVDNLGVTGNFSDVIAQQVM